MSATHRRFASVVAPLLHQLQIGVVDHLGPFVGFGGEEFAEFAPARFSNLKPA